MWRPIKRRQVMESLTQGNAGAMGVEADRGVHRSTDRQGRREVGGLGTRRHAVVHPRHGASCCSPPARAGRASTPRAASSRAPSSRVLAGPRRLGTQALARSGLGRHHIRRAARRGMAHSRRVRPDRGQRGVGQLWSLRPGLGHAGSCPAFPRARTAIRSTRWPFRSSAGSSRSTSPAPRFGRWTTRSAPSAIATTRRIASPFAPARA